MIEHNEVEVLGRVTLVSLHGIHLWTARKKISPADFPGVEFPPEQLMSLGSKHVLDPEQLKPFERCKREAHSECSRVGVRFLGGYAVPEEKLNELLVKLRDIKTKFISYRGKFLSNYDQFTSDWANADWKKPEWREMILRSITPKAEVACKFDFGFTAMKIVPHPDEELSEGLGDEVKGLTSELIKEVSTEARNIIQRGLLQRGTATQGTVNTLRKISEKIDGLAFLSPFVAVVSSYVSRVVNVMPTEGTIKDDDFQRLSSLVVSLSSEYGIKTLLNAAKQNHVSTEDPFEFLKDISDVARNEFSPILTDDAPELSVDETEAEQIEIGTNENVTSSAVDLIDSESQPVFVDEHFVSVEFSETKEIAVQTIEPVQAETIVIQDAAPPVSPMETLTFDW